jgi:uncharacterized repeat protein (TIGR03803 family)
MSRNRKRLSTLGAVMLVVIMVMPVLTPSAWAQSKYKTLYKFSGGKDGKLPQASLIFDQAGNLYGTTLFGGAHSVGTVFELTPKAGGSWTEKVLLNFNIKNGALPYGGLIFDASGNLYGTTDIGGAHNGGTVFKLAPNADGSWKESVLHSFCSLTNCGDGENPVASLIFDKAGNLYGTTSAGGTCVFGVPVCGVVFKLAPNADGSWRESVLYNFCPLTNCDDGRIPFAGLIFDQAGNLYGTTDIGGAHDGGTVFQLVPNADGSWRESVLYSFCSRTNCGDGAGPLASLIFDRAGNLYGTTASDGAHGGGTVFKLAPNADGSWRESMLHSFCSPTICSDGANPFASLIFDQTGNLYGTAAFGGDLSRCNSGPGCGVVFKLVPNSNGGWKETVLHTFFDHPGAFPLASVIFDPAGNLYGTTQGDARTTFGSVFEITP